MSESTGATVSEIPFEAPKSGESEPINKPEVYANPPLENIKLIYSTPVYKEWKEGTLLRHIRAVLSQHVAEGSAIESNYILNADDNYGESDKKASAEEERTQSLDFLIKIVEVQSLASKSDPESVQKLADLIESEKDLLLKDILLLAQKRAKQVAISAINIKNPLYQLGYSNGSDIAGFRSVGFDYAYKRLKDDQAIFLMNDADTVPANNNFVNDLTKIYDQNPAAMYVLLGLAYLPAGENKPHVSKSIYQSGFRTAGYNPWPMGAPQISFRKSAMEQMQGIATGNENYEDYETVRRLMNFFGGIQNGLLIHEAIFIPTQLTSDRSTGFVDGAGRRLEGMKMFEEVFDKANNGLEGAEILINKLDEPAKQEAHQQLVELRRTYHHQERLLHRFNRMVAIAFLNNLELGNIVIRFNEVKVNEEAIYQDGKNPFARPLLSFVRANQELIASLSPTDINLMKYYLLGGEFPKSIKELNPFQAAMREYLGEYPSGEMSMEELEQRYKNRRLQDKTTIFQPFVAEVLAYGNISTRYHIDDTHTLEERWVNMDKKLPERSAWLDEVSLPSSAPPEPETKDTHLQIFVSKYLPLGFLSQFIGSRK